MRELTEVVGDENADVFRKLIELFRRDGADRIEEVRRAAAGGSHDEVLALAHRLKSGAANLGLMRLRRACEELEDSARAGSTRLGADRAERLPELFHDGLRALDDWYSQRFGQAA